MFAFLRGISLLIMLSITVLFSQCLSADVSDTSVDPPDMSQLNPERGWYRSMETQEASFTDLLEYRKTVTLVAYETNLSEYLTRPLDAQKLNEIELAFSFARRAGLSVIYRAAYDFDGKPNPEPKDINIILKHISQMSPIFNKYEDILFNVQAGFLGSWGEWHHSYFGPQSHPDDPVRADIQRQVVNALLAAVPKSVTISVRRPQYVRNIRGDNHPISMADAFNGSNFARMAFHDDALMSDDTDMDTFIDPAYSPKEKEFAWISNLTRFTPFIGETNMVSSNNDPKNAVEFLDLINAQSLNIEYHPDVLKKWKRARQGSMSVYDYIGMKLGYRFELNNVTLSQPVHAGGELNMKLELENTGFGTLMKEKNFELVLTQGSQVYRTPIHEDARFWEKNEPINRSYDFHLPDNMPAGEWDVCLALSSTFDTLRANPAYSIRFFNKASWEANEGINKIGTISVSAARDDGGNEEFRQITP